MRLLLFAGLYSIRVLNVFDTLTYFLKSKFAIDILAGDLTFDLPRNAPVSVYTLLDVLFVCILSYDFHSYPCQFVDGGLILSLDLKFVQPMERLSYHMVSATSPTDNCDVVGECQKSTQLTMQV